MLAQRPRQSQPGGVRLAGAGIQGGWGAAGHLTLLPCNHTHARPIKPTKPLDPYLANTYTLSLSSSGVVDGYWEYRLKPWDMAAGIVIAQEAGATITTMVGTGWGAQGRAEGCTHTLHTCTCTVHAGSVKLWRSHNVCVWLTDAAAIHLCVVPWVCPGNIHTH